MPLKVSENTVYFDYWETLSVICNLHFGDILAVTVSLVRVIEEKLSSWNMGYGEKYFVDQGVLSRTI